MLFMILLGLSLAPASLAAEPQTRHVQPEAPAVVPPFESLETRKDCPDLSPRIAEERQRGMRPRRLDELPPGLLEFAVHREVDGCPIRAVVHENAAQGDFRGR
jgi:hypothetical protein